MAVQSPLMEERNTFSWIVLRPKTALKFSLNNDRTIPFSQVERTKCVKQKPHKQVVQTLGRIIILSTDSSFTVRLALPCQQLREHRQARCLPAWWFWCHSFDNQSEITRVQVRYFVTLNGRLRRGGNCVLYFPSFFLWRYVNSALNLKPRVRSFWHSDHDRSNEPINPLCAKDSSVYLIYHDPSALRSLIPIRIIPKERTLVCVRSSMFGCASQHLSHITDWTHVVSWFPGSLENVKDNLQNAVAVAS